MSKKILIILSTLMINIFFIYYLMDRKIDYSIKDKCGNNNNDITGCYADSIADIAIQKRNINLCEKSGKLFFSKFDVSRCYLNYIKSFPFLSECNKIKIDRYSCLGFLAAYYKDPKICLDGQSKIITEYQEDGKDQCLDGLRWEGVHDLSVCNMITSEFYKRNCILNYNFCQRDPDECKKFFYKPLFKK